MKCIPTRKVVKECGCRKPSLYICHGNSSFKEHGDGRNINYHFSLISAECSHSKLTKSRLLLMQLDRPSSFIIWVIMGHSWLLFLKCPRYPLLPSGDTRNEVERCLTSFWTLTSCFVRPGSILMHPHVCLFPYILAQAHSIRKERDFFGHLLKTKAAQGLILVFYFWKLFVSHTRRNLTLRALLGSKKA